MRVDELQSHDGSARIPESLTRGIRDIVQIDSRPRGNYNCLALHLIRVQARPVFPQLAESLHKHSLQAQRMEALMKTIACGGSAEEVTAAAEAVGNINGADNDGQGDGGVRPLTAAVLGENMAALRVLLSKGARTEVYSTVADYS